MSLASELQRAIDDRTMNSHQRTAAIEAIVPKVGKLESDLADLHNTADDLREQVQALEWAVEQSEYEVSRARRVKQAAHMLHEQAHGLAPWRTCQLEPCVHLALELQQEGPRGPAQLTLVGA